MPQKGNIRTSQPLRLSQSDQTVSECRQQDSNQFGLKLSSICHVKGGINRLIGLIYKSPQSVLATPTSYDIVLRCDL